MLQINANKFQDWKSIETPHCNSKMKLKQTAVSRTSKILDVRLPHETHVGVTCQHLFGYLWLVLFLAKLYAEKTGFWTRQKKLKISFRGYSIWTKLADVSYMWSKLRGCKYSTSSFSDLCLPSPHHPKQHLLPTTCAGFWRIASEPCGLPKGGRKNTWRWSAIWTELTFQP